MSAEASTSAPAVQQRADEMFEQLDAYDWSDPEFQSGIEAILGSMRAQGASEEQLQATEMRARVFFFSNKIGTQIPLEEYLAWKAQRSGTAAPSVPVVNGSASSESAAAASSSNAPAGEPYPASFDAIVELITSGRTDEIPGIKDIPLKINEEPPTNATLPKRAKPWEVRAEEPSA